MDKDFFVQTVKELCKTKGTPPTFACVESGAGRNFITDIKRGQTPSVAKVQLLAQYLGVTTSELLGEDPPINQAATPEGSPSPAEEQLLRKYRALSDVARGKLLGYLDALSS